MSEAERAQEEAEQPELELHLAEFDRWESMSDSEREKAIRWALR